MAAYAGLTAIAVSFRPEGVMGLLRSWVSISRETAVGARYGYMHLHEWVVAIAARTWTYHALYDDLLLVVPIVALLRAAREMPVGEGRAAATGLVVFAGWCSTLVPARLLTAPSPWDLAFRAGQTLVWAAVLVALVALASRPVADPGGPERGT